jgi:putative ABC transport system permease protein
MKLYEVLKTALSALRANKLRSSLTILGVIIGVFAVVTLIAFGKGMENYITDEFDKLGSNLIFVSPGSGDFTGDPAETYTNNKLANKHLKLIEQHANDFLVGIYPYNFVGENVNFKTKSYYSELVGVNYEGVSGFNYLVNSGRSFNKSEEKSEAKVVILGPNVVSELFGSSNPVGMDVKIGSERFEVIGTFESKGSNYDDGVIIPYTTLAEIFEIDNFSSIVAKVDDTAHVAPAIRQVELALLRDLRDDEFSVLSQADVLGSIQEILDIITIALGAIAGISLLVGGIGIMNIMLVSVTERTREVGLRKALGATPSNITIQFLVESVFLSVIGGIVGLGLGALATLSVQQFIRAEMTPAAIVTAFVFSVAVGVIFGTYPAINAGKKDPITALRYE